MILTLGIKEELKDGLEVVAEIYNIFDDTAKPSPYPDNNCIFNYMGKIPFTPTVVNNTPVFTILVKVKHAKEKIPTEVLGKDGEVTETTYIEGDYLKAPHPDPEKDGIHDLYEFIPMGVITSKEDTVVKEDERNVKTVQEKRKVEYENRVDSLLMEAVKAGLSSVDGKALIQSAKEETAKIKEEIPK